MFRVPELYRVLHGIYATTEQNGNNGAFLIPQKGSLDLRVIASDGLGWEHVSVSTATRCPTWEEMCRVKDLFWGDEDVVIQYHPAKADYVNHHPHCLHLWRQTNLNPNTPPAFLVGPKG
jgi:hypothetical protein